LSRARCFRGEIFINTSGTSLIDCILIDRRRHSSILHVRSFKGAVILIIIWWLRLQKVRETLAVSIQAAKKSDGERLKEVKKQYQIEISDMFANSENLSNNEDINSAWENIEKNIKTSAKESLCLYKLKQHKSWFDEGCLGFSDQRKQAKMQWVQYPSQSNVDDLNNVRREASRHFKTKRRNI